MIMPRPFNHVAISVTDMDSALQWYRDVMQMRVITEPVVISAQDNGNPNISSLVRSVFGPKLGSFKICHMISANGTGLELFQFLEPAAQRAENNFEYWKTGFFHISVTEPKIEELAERIALTGGKRRTGVMEVEPGSGKKICFCEDPFGNVIEIYSLSYGAFWGKLST